MVDLRETLSAAEAASIISRGTRDSLMQALKRLHFPERFFARLGAMAESLSGADGIALAAWLRAGHTFSQKRRDAEALLRRLLADVQPPPTFTFERAHVWERFRSKADVADGASPTHAIVE